MKAFLQRQIAKLPKIESTVLLLAIIIRMGVWGFVEIADEVMEGSTHEFDRAVLLALRTGEDHTDPIGPCWLEEMMRDFTALGGTGLLVLVAGSTIAYLLMEAKRRAALLVPHLSLTASASFPSGHTMMSTAIYLLLGALLARMHGSRHLKIIFLSCAVIFSLLVGASRVYLGVHWPTDVVAGWAAGAVWAALCWLAAWWLQLRHKIESPEEDVSALLHSV